MKIKQAFVLAGGKGERLKPLTETTPKPLVKVNGKPILEYSLELLKSHGVKRVILSVGYMHDAIEEYFGDGSSFGLGISYAVENEPLGTGGALKEAEAMLEERFFMLNGDNIADFDLTQMGEEHCERKGLGTITLVEVEDVTSYGVARISGQQIVEFIEKPPKEKAPSNLANAGCYCLEKKCLDSLPHGFNLIEKTLFPKLASIGQLNWFLHKGLWLTTDTFERIDRAEKMLRGEEKTGLF